METETTYYEFSLADYYNKQQNNVCSAIYNIVNDLIRFLTNNNLLVGGYLKKIYKM